MTSRPSSADDGNAFVHSSERIEEIDVSTEMRSSFLEYAYSVIYSRALPDARDGMKPVQRRILYQMDQMGLHFEVGHVKSSRVVGEVMGKLHPHGDAAIYDALVRLAQSFNLRVPLIDGHGNFGSLDDGPAAPRYTEARLSKAARALTDQLDEDTVDFVPNYDNQFQQPEVLPAAFPNLLVNGASGIAVGMATNIPAHNPVETINAAIYLLENPQATTADLMRFVPGPDFPGGGIVMGLEGVKDAYETGRGAFKVRAKCSIERVSSRRNGIIVTELPYMLGPERVIEKIKDGVSAGRLKGISAVSDLTDRDLGLRLQIDVKTGFDPQAVLAQLFKHTPLEDSFSVNAVALVDGKPQLMGLRDMLQMFVTHRIEVTTRRTQFRLGKHRDRLHLVEGLLRAVLNIDEVIQMIRQSNDAEVARQRLMVAFDLTEVQAQYILELRLRRLTKFSTLELENEQRDLLEQINQLEEILASREKLEATVVADLRETAKLVESPRRTVLLDSAGTRVAGAVGAEALPTIATTATASLSGSASLEVPDDPCLVLLSPDGQIARFAVETLDGETVAEVGESLRTSSLPEAEPILSILPTTARSQFAVVTAGGLAHRVDAVSLPALACPREAIKFAGAVPVHSVISSDSPAVAVIPLDGSQPLALGTKCGVIKRVRPEYPGNKDNWPIISLHEGDEVVGVSANGENCEGVFVTRRAQLLRIDLDAVRPQGAPASGMLGIKLAEGDAVIAFAAIPKAQAESVYVLTVAGTADELPGVTAGAVKLSPLTDFPTKGRAGQGVRAQRFLRGQDQLDLAWVGAHQPVAFTSKLRPVPLPKVAARRDASGTPANAPIRYVG